MSWLANLASNQCADLNGRRLQPVFSDVFRFDHDLSKEPPAVVAANPDMTQKKPRGHGLAQAAAMIGH